MIVSSLQNSSVRCVGREMGYARGEALGVPEGHHDTTPPNALQGPACVVPNAVPRGDTDLGVLSSTSPPR